jgi:hypothetical protein
VDRLSEFKPSQAKVKNNDFDAKVGEFRTFL